MVRRRRWVVGGLIGLGVVLALAGCSKLDEVAEVDAGFHSCAVHDDGTVTCWGSNAQGQLGDGTMTDRVNPVTVLGIDNATSVATGSNHSCALLADGTLRCWGYNLYGQLGDGSTGTVGVPTPVMVSGISQATALTAGQDGACALVAAGAVKCWGANDLGQVGNGTFSPVQPSPVLATGVSDATAIASGYGHTCALFGGGTLECWGYNSHAQLGDGATANSAVPVAVTGVGDATAVSSGGQTTCVVTDTSTLRCWGDNRYGQVGNGTTGNTSPPVVVSGIGSAAEVEVGGSYVCARLSDATLRCWGRNLFGSLGNGTMTDSTSPVTVSGITNATSISAGTYHACATLDDGTAKCWGLNGDGQLGDFTKTDRLTPVFVLHAR